MSTMRAVSIYTHGGPGVLNFEGAPCPHPGPGEVLSERSHARGTIVLRLV